MSQQNVDAVRRMNEGFSAAQNGDPDGITAALSVLDPEIRWHGTVGGIDEGEVAHGFEEVGSGFAENYDAWEKLDLRTERYIDAGARVVVFWHEIARSRHSEHEIKTNTAVVYTVRDGRVVEARGYMDRNEALESVGLSAEDVGPTSR